MTNRYVNGDLRYRNPVFGDAGYHNRGCNDLTNI